MILEMVSEHTFNIDPFIATKYYSKLDKFPQESQVVPFLKDAFPEVFSGNKFGVIQNNLLSLAQGMLNINPSKRMAYKEILHILKEIMKKSSCSNETDTLPLIFSGLSIPGNYSTCVNDQKIAVVSDEATKRIASSLR